MSLIRWTIAMLAVALGSWLLPGLNTHIRWIAITLLGGYIVVFTILTYRRGTVFKLLSVVCILWIIILFLAPGWLVPVAAIPVIWLTGACVYAGRAILQNGWDPAPGEMEQNPIADQARGTPGRDDFYDIATNGMNTTLDDDTSTLRFDQWEQNHNQERE